MRWQFKRHGGSRRREENVCEKKVVHLCAKVELFGTYAVHCALQPEGFPIWLNEVLAWSSSTHHLLKSVSMKVPTLGK